MILLDTHILLFYLLGDPKIKTAKMLNKIDAGLKKGDAFISSISLWEISMLVSKGRIKISENSKDWLKKIIAATEIKTQNINIEIAADSCDLPGTFHGDPVDRIIVATARFLDASLFTFDKQILKYAKKGYLKV